MNHELKGLYGVAYSCSNRENKYCDDWLTEKYKNVYRNDNIRSVKNVKQLGFNHIRTYYLRPNDNHNDFLSHLDELNLTVEIGLSNDLLEKRDSDSIKKIINSTKDFKCVKMYLVGNEYFGDVWNIVWALELIHSIDNKKYLIHSAVFDPGFNLCKNILTKINNKSLSEKYVVSLNTYFYSNPAHTHGDVIQNVVKDFYSDPILKNSYLIISEFGNNKDSEQWNSIWNFLHGSVECIKNNNKFLGFCLFSYSNESWKGDNNGENNYGIVRENGERKDGYHAVEHFKSTDAYKYINYLKRF